MRCDEVVRRSHSPVHVRLSRAATMRRCAKILPLRCKSRILAVALLVVASARLAVAHSEATSVATSTTSQTPAARAAEAAPLPDIALAQNQLLLAEIYKRMNAGMLAGLNINMSRGNDSYDYEGGDDDDAGCYNGQNPIGNLITMVLYASVCIVGLFGNTLVIYVVLRFSKMQTVTNIYILNLAIADECFLIGIPFLLYTMQNGSWPFGEYVCKAYMVSTSVTQFTSSIFLLIMSADRYIAVCHPISSPRFRTPVVSKAVSALAWLTSVLLMLPVLLFASTVLNGEHISCNIKWPEAQNTQSGTTFILYTLALGFATPLTFILIFYCLVIRKLRTVGPKHKSKEKKRSHRKVTKLVLTVITVYILCWLPYWISQVALINSSPSQCASRLEITIFLLVGCLGYSNSAMNPILYAFLSDNFKKSFMKACTCAARKDVNAQLQLENSLFPKFGKSRQSERLIASNKAKQQKKALMARNNNASQLQTTTTTTTTTTSGFGGTTATTIAADPAPAPAAPLTIAKEGTHAAVLLVTAINTTNTDAPDNGTTAAETMAAATDIGWKPPVLHTDL